MFVHSGNGVSVLIPAGGDMLLAIAYSMVRSYHNHCILVSQELRQKLDQVVIHCPHNCHGRLVSGRAKKHQRLGMKEQVGKRHPSAKSRKT